MCATKEAQTTDGRCQFWNKNMFKLVLKIGFKPIVVINHSASRVTVNHGYKLDWGGVQLECKGRGYCTSPRLSKSLVQNTFARLCFVLLFTSKSPAVPVQCRIITSDILTSRLAPICQTVLRCPGHLKSPRGGRVGGLFSVFSISQFPDLSHSVIWSLSLHLSLSHTHTHNVGHFWRME